MTTTSPRRASTRARPTRGVLAMVAAVVGAAGLAVACTPEPAVCLNLAPHDQRHRHGSQDLHPGLDHQRTLAELALHGDLIRLAATGQNVVTLWRSRSWAR